jgi:hypothetical protein
MTVEILHMPNLYDRKLHCLLQFHASVIIFYSNLLSHFQMLQTTVDGRFIIVILIECGTVGGYQGLGGAYLHHFHGKTTCTLKIKAVM